LSSPDISEQEYISILEYYVFQTRRIVHLPRLSTVMMFPLHYCAFMIMALVTMPRRHRSVFFYWMYWHELNLPIASKVGEMRDPAAAE